MTMVATDSNTPQHQKIDLWLLDIRKAGPSLFVAAENMMSPQEKIRAAKIIRGKQEFIASRWLMRRVLADYTACAPDALEFVYSAKGKPGIKHSQYRFSLSHSGHWALLAVGAHEWLGVDIESSRATRDLPGIARNFFHPQEFQQLDALPETQQADYFYQLWTLKEAFFKALGSGISAGLEKMCISFNNGQISVDISPELDTEGASAVPSDWQFYHRTLEFGLQAALAYQAQQSAKIQWFDALTLAID